MLIWQANTQEVTNDIYDITNDPIREYLCRILEWCSQGLRLGRSLKRVV